MPVSSSNVNNFRSPKTLIHVIDMQSNKSLVLREGDIIIADHLMQQSIKWTNGMHFSPPRPGWSAEWRTSMSNCTSSWNANAKL